jgi:uncharacterized repeat protein (TIGR03803 family)
MDRSNRARRSIAHLRIGVWLSACAAAIGAGSDGTPAFRVISYMDRYDQPVGIVEGAPGIFYSNAGASPPVAFSFNRQGAITILAKFSSGEHILGPLVSASNGRFYSAVQRGGSTPPVEFSVAAAADTKQVYAPQSLSPMLTQSLPDGTLLGVAFSSGPYHLVRSDLDGRVTSIYQFPSGERLPIAAIYGTDGNFYGVATRGGSGYVYRVTPAGQIVKLAQFEQSFGSDFVFAPLLQARDGDLYGVTPAGGANGKGSVYKVTLGGQSTRLYDFTGGANAHPTSLIEASDGNLYGAAQGSGASSQLFRLTTSGRFTLLYEMENLARDGQCPCSLVQSSDGILYGTAARYGATGAGALFALDLHLPKPAPAPLDFTPKSGRAGTRVRIWGEHLLSASVRFNGVAATDVSSSGPNCLWATAPSGAASGPITVTNPGGTAETKGRFLMVKEGNPK